MIVARYEVPGKRPLKEPSRRVRYDRALLIPEVFLVESAFRADVRCDGPFPEHLDFFCFTSETSSLQYCNHPNRSAHTCQNQTVPYGTALLGAIPRHFVPGYDRTPSGTKAIRPWEASLS
jgi:hypothetical protein